MIRNVLLPTDFSDNSWNAIMYAIHFFGNVDCHFYLLHVDRPYVLNTTPTVYGVSLDVLNATYSMASKEQLKNLLHRIKTITPNNKNHRFFTLAESGAFIETIRTNVEEHKIDMIIMGTKGANGLKKLLIGSNAGDVITKVKCTTLIVPENATYTPVTEIAFPTDYSLSYEVGHLQPIASIMERFQAALSILHITKKSESLSLNQQKNKELLEEFFSQQPISFHQITNTKIEEAIEFFVENREISMMAMVAKNLNYFQQILFHSKIKNISYHTDIPFLVMHDT